LAVAFFMCEFLVLDLKWVSSFIDGTLLEPSPSWCLMFLLTLFFEFFAFIKLLAETWSTKPSRTWEYSLGKGFFLNFIAALLLWRNFVFLALSLVMLLDIWLYPAWFIEEPLPEGVSILCNAYLSLSLISGESHPADARWSKLLKSVGCGLKTCLLGFFGTVFWTNGPELKYFIGGSTSFFGSV